MAEAIDIMSAIRQIAAERKIDVDDIVDAIKQAVATVYKKETNSDLEQEVNVEFNPDQGHIAIYVTKSVVKKVTDPNTEISLKEATSIDKKLALGDSVSVDVTPSGDFGRIAAQTARQVILQKLREAEKEAAIKQIKDLIGTIEVVVVQSIDPKTGDVICEINKARAVMPSKDRIPTEFYKLGSRIRVLLKSIEEDTKGKFVLVSRADPDFLRELFKAEVPEIDSGSVEIVAIAREAGSRSKVAVKSNAPGIDPIGSCVGQKGVRINTITNELKSGIAEEKIDIILWDDDIQTFLMNAIRPADSIKVEITDKKERTAVIVVPDDQYSLAIGKEGQNARLAAKLTGWTIDIKSEADSKAKEE